MDELRKRIASLGGKLFVVGGAVRDELLGRNTSDKDFLVTGVSLNDIKGEFPTVAGKDFPVFLIDVDGEMCEVAMARKEKKNGKGHGGFEFFTDENVTVEQDLERRDLTINAIAKNVETGEIIDPFGGIADIKNRVLRHVSDAFREDPLRVMRVARFYAQLKHMGFLIANETCDLISDMEESIETLTAERVFKEMEKALKSRNPEGFFWVLRNTGLLHVWFPELAALDVPDKHNGTALQHTLDALSICESYDPIVRYAVICHDLGKGLTPKNSHPCHYGHDKLGESPVNEMSSRLKVPSKWAKLALISAEQHMRAYGIRHGKVITLVTDLGDMLDDFLQVCKADCASGVRSTAYVNMAARLYKAREVCSVVTGKTLRENGNEKTGKAFGEALLQARIRKMTDAENLFFPGLRGHSIRIP